MNVWDVNRQSSNGDTPLHKAARAGCVDTILLKYGAISSIRNVFGKTPTEEAEDAMKPSSFFKNDTEQPKQTPPARRKPLLNTKGKTGRFTRNDKSDKSAIHEDPAFVENDDIVDPSDITREALKNFPMRTLPKKASLRQAGQRVISTLRLSIVSSRKRRLEQVRTIDT